MKFINYLESITGVGIYPLTSLLIFFLFFTVLLLWVFRADKKYIRNLKQIPFPDHDDQ
ncbi:CcoQ/FixQ family Cbb3-type cytochrome c oxidase assembly chaperone [Taibaiella soli]|uniref:CcoQ/FixQ family Cbb3-type cytochrome c oxidase assembly chaperone n=1 Tax=Taibaiella soli TaxID=1649169 RepID=A0A2W2ACJ4_9BACT|nr:CcoQ/FixQ family Cbb3-type cytochrome c oxidase assembly chaperone [Taibaiella soli]PZF71342.1 CcoQ/FixQ family Cbb3-type cytochrome c oxidase assembly chaperone [Taibaiella soli]